MIGDDHTPPCFDHGTVAQWHDRVKFLPLPRLEQRASQSGVYSEDLRLEIKERLDHWRCPSDDFSRLQTLVPGSIQQASLVCLP